MKLALKQKVFSLKEAFTVMNEAGEPVYEVSGKLISVGHKLTVRDLDGQEAAYIHQKRCSAWYPSTSSRSTARRRWS